MKTVIICSGGPEEELFDLSSLKETPSTYFIGADRGAMHLYKRGIIIDEIIGDFDSISHEELEKLKKVVKKVSILPSEKDETDTELALQRALSYKPEEIIMTGVTGGRLDHFQSAIHLLYRVQTMHQNTNVIIRNRSNEIRLLKPDTHHIKYDPKYKYVSFFSFEGPVEDVTLRGFKYETSGERIHNGITKFTSNEITSKVCTISFSSGICLMIRGTDV